MKKFILYAILAVLTVAAVAVVLADDGSAGAVPGADPFEQGHSAAEPSETGPSAVPPEKPYVPGAKVSEPLPGHRPGLDPAHKDIVIDRSSRGPQPAEDTIFDYENIYKEKQRLESEGYNVGICDPNLDMSPLGEAIREILGPRSFVDDPGQNKVVSVDVGISADTAFLEELADSLSVTDPVLANYIRSIIIGRSAVLVQTVLESGGSQKGRDEDADEAQGDDIVLLEESDDEPSVPVASDETVYFVPDNSDRPSNPMDSFFITHKADRGKIMFF